MSGDGAPGSHSGLNGVAKAVGIVSGVIAIVLAMEPLFGWNPLGELSPGPSGTASPTPLDARPRIPPTSDPGLNRDPNPDRTGCEEAFRILKAPVPERESDLGPVYAYAVQQAAQLQVVARKTTNPAVTAAVRAYATDWDSLGSAVQDHEDARHQAERFVNDAKLYTESYNKHNKDVAEFGRQQRYYESRGDIRNATIAHNNAVAADENARVARNQSSTLLQKSSEATAQVETASQRMTAVFRKLRADVKALGIACD
ncbi:hypothetical protein JOD64_004544 [Micromonospora luteifusca]|uniref:Uncharacterized protein n=1 Tax=Micromonospora luteifusca TaxID=709860 RepID=A0ABS2LYS0_9ACTN|nr:hypothetical protein [Micromonospora luteifusca]MBM7493322.1 hypothetical protein [Micromonospora luteifusca]